MEPDSFAIIGAGVAGLTCGHFLSVAGKRVWIYDKGRSPGGRLATRRVQTLHGDLSFDHGAQYITAQDPDFARLISALAGAGSVSEWRRAPVVLDRRGRLLDHDRSPLRRWSGRPGMNSFGTALAEGLKVRTSARIEETVQMPDGWFVKVENQIAEPEGPFDAIVVATPAEQARPLLQMIAPAAAMAAASARTRPCWAFLLAFEKAVGAPFEAAWIKNGPLSWVARQNNVDGRQGPEAWVVHATPDWSQDRIEASPEDVTKLLLPAFADLFGDLPTPMVAQAHRWRYAFVETPAPTAYYWDAAAKIGVCGDWRIGPRIEAAWSSGRQLAAAILAGGQSI